MERPAVSGVTKRPAWIPPYPPQFPSKTGSAGEHAKAYQEVESKCKRYKFLRINDPERFLADMFKLGDTQRFSVLVEATPGLMEAVSAHKGKNRNIRRGWAKRYGRAMSEGRWPLTAEPICFSYRRDLIEGQHRVDAVSLSGAAVLMTFWFGCEPEEFKHLNRGKARTAANDLEAEGHKYANILAAMGAISLRLKSGNQHAIFETDECSAEARAMIKLDPSGMTDACRIGHAASVAKPKIGVTPSAAAYAYYYINNESEADVETINEFFAEFESGSRDPNIKRLREEMNDPTNWDRSNGWSQRDNLVRQAGSIVNCFLRWSSPIRRTRESAPKQSLIWENPLSLPTIPEGQ